MSDAPDSAAAGGGSADAVNTEGDSPASSELKISESTILMEVADNVMIWRLSVLHHQLFCLHLPWPKVKWPQNNGRAAAFDSS